MKLHLIIALVAGASASPAFSALFTSGHGDIGIAYEEEPGEPSVFFLHNHVSPNGVVDGMSGSDQEFAAGDSTIVVPLTTMGTQSDSQLDAGTGVSGGPIWALSDSSTEAAAQGAPFLGFAAEELTPSDWDATAMITFTLGSVTSPSGSGSFSAWNRDGFGNPLFFLSTEGAGLTENNNTITIPAGTESHFNLGFSEPGNWGIEFTVAGTHVVDGPQSSTGTFNFTVVPEPSSALLAAIGSLALMRRRRS